MKTYYVIKSARGKLKLNELPGNHIYTIHCSTQQGAESALRMLQAAQKRIDEESAE